MKEEENLPSMISLMLRIEAKGGYPSRLGSHLGIPHEIRETCNTK
jgi:hypothetical protein